jgi:hypothetical protein
MGLTVASYDVCQQVNAGVFSCSGSCAEGSGDPCGNCGVGVNLYTSGSQTTTITIPYGSLIYNPENMWGTFVFAWGSACTTCSGNITISFLNSSGSTIASYTIPTPQGSTSPSYPPYIMLTYSIPSGTENITVELSTTCSSICSTSLPGQIAGYILYMADVIFFSQPVEYYIEPLFFYNQSLSYSITINYSETGYVTAQVASGSTSNLSSYSACVNYNNSSSSGSVCATYYFLTQITELTTFVVTGNANNVYQITWSQQVAVPILNSSCQLSQIFLFNITGYNNILNPAEYTFTIQTPFNGSISKSYTLLIPVGYFKLLPSYSLSCSTSPCTSGFTTFTITVDIQTSSGVVIASQQVDVLSGQTFTTFNLEDYYGGQTLDVVITLDINATLSQTVTLTMNFEYEVLAQT